MPENSGININTGDSINQEVTNTVEQLPESNQGGLPGIREVLTQLQTVIQAEDSLQPDKKTKALQQVQILAQAGKNPQVSQHQTQAETAMGVLREISAELPKTTTLITTFNQVLPNIAEIFGLG